MKKEALMMLIAGVVLGAVLGFIGTRQYYMDKMAATPAPASLNQPGGQVGGQQGGPQGGMGGAQGGAQPKFDPNQHMAMVAQIQAEIDKDPKNVEKRIMLGNIYYDGGRWELAIPFYEQALKLEPNNTDVIVDLGVCLRNVKKADEALAMFDRALKVDPAKKQALFNRVVVYGFDKGDKAKALEVLKEFRAKYPDEPAGKQLQDELGKH